MIELKFKPGAEFSKSIVDKKSGEAVSGITCVSHDTIGYRAQLVTVTIQFEAEAEELVKETGDSDEAFVKYYTYCIDNALKPSASEKLIFEDAYKLGKAAKCER